MFKGDLTFIDGITNVSIYTQKMNHRTTLRLKKFGRRGIFQHDNDPKHTALKKNKKKIKAMTRPSMSPDMNPIEHIWSNLKGKVK